LRERALEKKAEPVCGILLDLSNSIPGLFNGALIFATFPICTTDVPTAFLVKIDFHAREIGLLILPGIVFVALAHALFVQSLRIDKSLKFPFAKNYNAVGLPGKILDFQMAAKASRRD